MNHFSNIKSLTRRKPETRKHKNSVVTFVQSDNSFLSNKKTVPEQIHYLNSSVPSINTNRCPRYYSQIDHANYLIDSCCKSYNQCNNLEEELESAKSKCDRLLKMNDITGFETDENNQVIDNNSVCGLLHSRISQIKATKDLFVQNYIDVIEFIVNAVNKSDAINNDNKYGIIFKNGIIQNTKNVFLKKIHDPKPITLHMALLEQANLANSGVFKYYLGIGGKKQTRRKVNKKKSNKKKSNKKTYKK
jgi:hypothetical protein